MFTVAFTIFSHMKYHNKLNMIPNPALPSFISTTKMHPVSCQGRDIPSQSTQFAVFVQRRSSGLTFAQMSVQSMEKKKKLEKKQVWVNAKHKSMSAGVWGNIDEGEMWGSSECRVLDCRAPSGSNQSQLGYFWAPSISGLWLACRSVFFKLTGKACTTFPPC